MEQVSMFGNRNDNEPLASRVRPRNLSEYVGQQHIVGEGTVLRNMIESDKLSSMIFWGPPGVGKTTLARIIAEQTNAEFLNFSAVTSGIKGIRDVMKSAEKSRFLGNRTILFIDEIHRFTKSQQDAFLPYVERGTIILIGATTENPSFEINGALLSRCRVFMLKPLQNSDLIHLLRNSLTDSRGFGNADLPEGSSVAIDGDLISWIANFANGDARTALSVLEMAVINGEKQEDGRIRVTRDVVSQCTETKALLYDKNGEEHYNLISALHKSMRNSDPDAAVYWLSRMLEAGENPLYVARRLVRFSSEDVGMADPKALQIAVAAYQASHFIGMPECSVSLTEAVVYLSLAPKSNALYMAYEHAKQDALHDLASPVPMNIRNAVTGLMEEEGYGKGYQYAHNSEEKLTAMQCLPDHLEGKAYYEPTSQGLELRYRERLEAIKKWKKMHRG